MQKSLWKYLLCFVFLFGIAPLTTGCDEDGFGELFGDLDDDLDDSDDLEDIGEAFDDFFDGFDD